MSDCPCPKHPFYCYGHPHSCGCSEAKYPDAQDLLEFLDQYFTSATPQERVYDACVGLLEHFEVSPKANRSARYALTSKEAK